MAEQFERDRDMVREAFLLVVNRFGPLMGPELVATALYDTVTDVGTHLIALKPASQAGLLTRHDHVRLYLAAAGTTPH
jgi:hypothetical protein